ncbi:MAG: SPOR domain-containing protein [Gallionella sp.]|nr:SPOR domain-containing protein [Gallionella sp.]MDD4947516.1 SPOR domain-containing protein [Gallionella sp.]MDD5612507.1 SPOR domain-containing protein [Gallionella sp.]
MNKGVKIFFWLLVVVNVGVFAVMKSGVFDKPLPVPAQRESNADKIILLNIPEVAVESTPAVAEHAVAASAVAASPVIAKAEPAAPEPVKPKAADNKGTPVCYEWGEFSGADSERARKALVKLQLDKNLSQRDTEQPNVYWVYIPPQKDKAAVTQKVAQLKARGVTDYFVVQEAGEWLNAISLGMFKTHEAAQKYLDDLSTKDVRTAKVGERASKPKSTVFIISSTDSEKIVKLTALQKDFQNAELKSASCH